MSTTAIYKRGDQVSFTDGPLGLLADAAGSRFLDDTIPAGTLGVYEGPHPNLPDWHMVRVELPARTAFCPVHAGQIEAKP